MSRGAYLRRFLASCARHTSCATENSARTRLALGASTHTFASTPTRANLATRSVDATARVRTFASDVDNSKDATSAPSASSDANSRKDLYMMFTCGQCETRAVRGFSRQAYENGVVIVTCPGCSSKHVVADRMGWFGEPGSVEDFIAQADTDGGASQKVTRGSVTLEAGNDDGTLEINATDLEAWKASFSSTTTKEQ